MVRWCALLACCARSRDFGARCARNYTNLIRATILHTVDLPIVVPAGCSRLGLLVVLRNRRSPRQRELCSVIDDCDRAGELGSLHPFVSWALLYGDRCVVLLNSSRCDTYYCCLNNCILVLRSIFPCVLNTVMMLPAKLSPRCVCWVAYNSTTC